MVLGSINSIKAKTFITNDHLMTPRLGTDVNQVKTWEWVSDAFNKKLPNKAPDSDGVNVTLNIGFPGQYYDVESQLYYNWNRYYDAKNGRYITSDPIGLKGGMTSYGYVMGNPLSYYDNLGTIVIPAPVVAGVVMGGVQAFAVGVNDGNLGDIN